MNCAPVPSAPRLFRFNYSGQSNNKNLNPRPFLFKFTDAFAQTSFLLGEMIKFCSGKPNDVYGATQCRANHTTCEQLDAISARGRLTTGLPDGVAFPLRSMVCSSDIVKTPPVCFNWKNMHILIFLSNILQLPQVPGYMWTVVLRWHWCTYRTGRITLAKVGARTCVCKYYFTSLDYTGGKAKRNRWTPG